METKNIGFSLFGLIFLVSLMSFVYSQAMWTANGGDTQTGVGNISQVFTGNGTAVNFYGVMAGDIGIAYNGTPSNGTMWVVNYYNNSVTKFFVNNGTATNYTGLGYLPFWVASDQVSGWNLTNITVASSTSNCWTVSGKLLILPAGCLYSVPAGTIGSSLILGLLENTKLLNILI